MTASSMQKSLIVMIYLTTFLLGPLATLIAGIAGYAMWAMTLGFLSVVVDTIRLKYYTTGSLCSMALTWIAAWRFSNWTWKSLAAAVILFFVVKFIFTWCTKGEDS